MPLQELSAADDLWPDLARRADLNPERYSVIRTWRKVEPDREHLVQVLSSEAGRVVFKRVLRSSGDHGFGRSVQAQQAAATAMGRANNRVPRVLSHDTDHAAMVMEYVDGTNVYDEICEHGHPGRQLRRAGAWMADFHRATRTGSRRFQPRFMADHLRRILADMDAGRARVAEPEAFRRHALGVLSMADQFDGGQTVSARTHGDMNLRNILLCADGAAGIDFVALHDAPVGFDIARFLLHFAGLFPTQDTFVPGQYLPENLLKAFFRGYDLVGADDPSVRFLLPVRLLIDWRKLPGDPTAMSLPEVLRFEALRRIAAMALPG